MKTMRISTRLAMAGLLLAAGVWLTLETTAQSQSPGRFVPTIDVFLKIQGVEGGATDGGHPGWIDVESFTYGLTRSAGSAESATHRGLAIVKGVDRATPFLYLHCSSGQPIEEVVLEVTRTASDGVCVQEYRLRNATVTSVSTAAGSNTGQATERLTLHYEAVEWTYVKVDPVTGSVVSEVTTLWAPKTDGAQ